MSATLRIFRIESTISDRGAWGATRPIILVSRRYTGCVRGNAMERRLAVILAADVVGYSALMERDEAGTFERLKAGRKELFEPEIERHHGRIFKLMGRWSPCRVFERGRRD